MRIYCPLSAHINPAFSSSLTDIPAFCLLSLGCNVRTAAEGWAVQSVLPCSREICDQLPDFSLRILPRSRCRFLAVSHTGRFSPSRERVCGSACSSVSTSSVPRPRSGRRRLRTLLSTILSRLGRSSFVSASVFLRARVFRRGCCPYRHVARVVNSLSSPNPSSPSRADCQERRNELSSPQLI